MDGDQRRMTAVIADFLEQGHSDTIVSLLRSEPEYFEVAGELVRDERFMVRLGLALVFEEMAVTGPEAVARALPSLEQALDDPSPLYRGEAATLLGMIHLPESRRLIEKLLDDHDPQVREVAVDILDGWQ